MCKILSYRILREARKRWTVTSRFEKYAVVNKWDKSILAYFSALLKGRALDVYDRLSVWDAADYEMLKRCIFT